MYSQMCKHNNFDLLVSVEVTYLCRLCQRNCVSHRPAVCLYHRRYRVVSHGTCCVSCPGVWYAVSSVCRTQSVGRAVYLVQVSDMLSRLSTGHSLWDVLCILSRCLRCCLVCLPDTVCVTCCVSCPGVWAAVSSVCWTQSVGSAVYLVQVFDMLSRLSAGHSLCDVLCILSRCLRCCLVCLPDTVCVTCCVSCPGVWDAVSSVYWTQSLGRAVYLVQVSEMLSHLSTGHSLWDVLCILSRCLRCCLVCLSDTVSGTCCVSCPGVWDAVSSVYRAQFVWRAVYLVQVFEMLSRLSTGHSLCDVLCILSRCLEMLSRLSTGHSLCDVLCILSRCLRCCLVCLPDTVCVTCCVSCPAVWDAVSSVYWTQSLGRAVYLVQVSEMLSRLSTGHSLWDVLCILSRCLRCCLVCLPDTVCVTCCVSCSGVWNAVSSVYRIQFVWRAVYLFQVSEMLSRLSTGHSLCDTLCILSRCPICCLVCLPDTVCVTCCVSCPGVWDAVSSVYWTQFVWRAVYLVQVSEMLSRLSTGHSMCDVLCILSRCLRCCLVCLPDTVCVTCCVSCPGVWYAVSSVCRTQFVWRAVYLVQVSEMLSPLSTGHSLWDVLCILYRCLGCCLVCLPDTVCVTCCVSCPGVWDAVSSVYRIQFVWCVVYLVQVSEMLSRLSTGHSLCDVLCILSRCLGCCIVCLPDTVCVTCCVSCPGVWDAVSSVYRIQFVWCAVYLVQVSEMLSRLSTGHSLYDVLCILSRCRWCCLVCLRDTVCVTCCVSCPGVWDAVSSVYRTQSVGRAVYTAAIHKPVCLHRRNHRCHLAQSSDIAVRAGAERSVCRSRGYHQRSGYNTTGKKCLQLFTLNHQKSKSVFYHVHHFGWMYPNTLHVCNDKGKLPKFCAVSKWNLRLMYANI